MNGVQCPLITFPTVIHFMFNHQADELRQLAQQALALARKRGATAAEIDISESLGQAVSVRLGEIEQIEYQQDKSLDITVYVGQRKGRAASADFSSAAVASTVQAAVDIARFTASDECAGLAEAELMARTTGDLALYHPWDLPVEAAVALAQSCEAAALAVDARIDNSEGASVHVGQHQYVYANSHDFLGYERSSRHSISCSVVATDAGGMQRDYWYDQARRADHLSRPERIGQIAAERALSRLGARSVPTGTWPVLFDTTVSGSLIGHLIGGLSGSALYRQTSFLADSLGRQILPAWLQLCEQPHLPGGLASACYDAEGVATQARDVIRDGVVQGYFLSSYSARKLGMTTTANAGGVHNLRLNPTHADQAQLLQQMGTGLLVTELMGQGVNMLTGDYSRGAAGFWVENGVIAHPVEEITIAARLQDMFLNLVGVSDDALPRSAHQIGSILVAEMTVAGPG